jgi:hypothetical protein
MGAGRRLSSGLVALACAGCVVGSPQRPTQAEAVAGPPPPPSEDKTAQQIIDERPRGEARPDAPPGKGRPGEVWVAGYWHWDGTHHAWVPGRWEKAPAPTGERR